ncbi:MAG: response regulator [Thiolinea sp.]
MQSTGKVINFSRVRRTETSSPRSRKPKILFVDDEERILNTMQALFRRQYDTTTTTDGYHALELLQQDHYQLLVSDQRMPIMKGVDLLREAKKVSPDTVRILLTGFSDLAAIIGSVNEGEVFRFLNKPWNTQEFVATVDEAVRIGLELQEAANDEPHPGIDLNHQPEKIRPVTTTAAESTSQPLPTNTANAYADNLIVLRGDDEMLASTRSMLPGCRIFTANSHDEAIDLMVEHEIGVIVCNVDDDHDGALEFFSLLKREHPQVVSVLLANSGDSTTLIHLINNARVFRYMFKPVRERLMLRYLTSAIDQYHKFKVAPTLLKQQSVLNKPQQTENNPVNTDKITGDSQKTTAPVAQNNTNILGKMRKIRSFFSRLVSG